MTIKAILQRSATLRALVQRARSWRSRSLRSWGRWVAWSRTRILGTPLVLADRRGILYEVEYGDTYAHLAGAPRSRREFTDDPTVLAYLERTLKPAHVVVDIGASSGVIALLAGRLVGDAGRVFAIEAEATNFNRLSRNIARNGLANVKPYHLAIADHGGDVTLNVFPQSRRGWHTLGGVAHRDVAAIGAQRVACTTIDAFLAREHLDHVDLLKIDIEGAEPEAFAGAARSLSSGALRRIVFEISVDPLRGMNHDIDDVIQPLRAAGYRIASITGHGTLADVDPAAIEKIYLANLVAVFPGAQ